nr:uncharacterized protein LOC129277898 isoform X1 [Lytechinus pictus]
MKKTAAIKVSKASDVAGNMKKPLICFISPLSRPASQRTGIRKKRLIAGTKKVPCKQGTDRHPHKSVVSLSDHDISALKSSAMKTAHAFTKTVKSRRGEKASDLNQDQCDNIQESAKTYRITRKKSSPFSSVASKSPRIQKHQHGMLFISPGKRSRSKSIQGLDGIHRRCTVSLTPEDKKKLSKAIEKRIRKQRKSGKDQNAAIPVGDLSFSTSDHDASFLSSNRSFMMEVHGSTESLKHQNQCSRLDRISNVSDEPTAMITSKKSISMKTAEPNLPGVLKQRNKRPFVSPVKRSLSKPKHGSDRISQGRTVSMTIVDMKKFDKAIKSKVKKRKINETIDRDAQSLELDISNGNDVSCSSSNKSVGMKVDGCDSSYNPKQDDFLQRIDEMYPESDMKRKKPCMTMSKGSSSHRIQKQQNRMYFVSPGKKYRQTASVPSKGKKKIQESINYCGTKMKKPDKINVKTRPDNSSLTTSDYDVSRSSSSPGLEADSFLSGMAYKTKDSTQNLKHDDHPRSEDNVDLYVQEPEPTLQNKAVSPKLKQKMEAITHTFGFEIQRKSGRTPNLDFKKLDEVYERRFNPSQRDNQEKKSSDKKRSRADLKLKKMPERRFNPTEDCPEAVVNMDTVARIRSIQNGQTNSRSSSPPSIQRCAFARDIIHPESDEMSDSTVDEADRSLLEKEISNFFEGKRRQTCLDFRKGAVTFDVTPNYCVRQETMSSGNGPVTSTGQNVHSDNVQNLDDVIVIDDSHCNITQNILQEVKDNQTSLKSASPAVQKDASASTEYNFGEHLPIDVDVDEPLNDACTPYQHSTPAGSNHHHEAQPKTTSSNSPAPWAAIEMEKGLFVMYCHEETAPCILKDLEGYPNIIQSSSLTMTYLSEKSLVKVQGMVLLKEHSMIRPIKVPKEEDKADKREKHSKPKKKTKKQAKNKKEKKFPKSEAEIKRKEAGNETKMMTTSNGKTGNKDANMEVQKKTKKRSSKKTQMKDVHEILNGKQKPSKVTKNKKGKENKEGVTKQTKSETIKHETKVDTGNKNKAMKSKKKTRDDKSIKKKTDKHTKEGITMNMKKTKKKSKERPEKKNTKKDSKRKKIKSKKEVKINQDSDTGRLTIINGSATKGSRKKSRPTPTGQR